MPDDTNPSVADLQPRSIESRASWIAAGVTLAILSVAYGSPLLIVVGLRVSGGENPRIDGGERLLAPGLARLRGMTAGRR
jgi:hypothetical protein